jgi:phage terminase large subunit-like protein
VVQRLASMEPEERLFVVRRLTVPQMRTFVEFWFAWARDGQLAPAGAWATWLLMAGRGFGKTRAGAEWVSGLARSNGSLRIALVGATIEDALKVMVLGESGIVAVARTDERVEVNKAEGTLRFSSGATAFLYSGACPEKLRGPQHHVAWCDEIAKWRYAQETWDNLQLGLRLGLPKGLGRPRAMVTTTPRAVPLMRRLVETAVLTRGRMADNDNLGPAFVDAMEAAYRGTRKGREELDGEMVEDVEGALWTRALVEEARRIGSSPRDLKRIVIGVDPPASAAGDACGIVACGLDAEGVAHVLGDHSVRGLSPEGWASRVVAAAQAWGADCVIVETNQGGEMATAVLKAADPALPVRPAFARYGKGDRAEPVAFLFEQGKVRIAGSFAELEDEMCALTRGGGYAGPGRSPDRADAMVWALSELMLGRDPALPRIRSF